MKISLAVTREIKPDWLSRQIMKRLGTDYSHCIIIIDEYVWQSTGKGFWPIPLNLFLNDRIIVDSREFELSGNGLVYANGWLQGKRGIEYSSSQYLGFIFPWMRKFVANGLEKMICSEVQYLFAVDCLLMKRRFIHSDFIDPKMSWNEIKKYWCKINKCIK